MTNSSFQKITSYVPLNPFSGEPLILKEEAAKFQFKDILEKFSNNNKGEQIERTFQTSKQNGLIGSFRESEEKDFLSRLNPQKFSKKDEPNLGPRKNLDSIGVQRINEDKSNNVRPYAVSPMDQQFLRFKQEPLRPSPKAVDMLPTPVMIKYSTMDSNQQRTLEFLRRNFK